MCGEEVIVVCLKARRPILSLDREPCRGRGRASFQETLSTVRRSVTPHSGCIRSISAMHPEHALTGLPNFQIQAGEECPCSRIGCVTVQVGAILSTYFRSTRAKTRHYTASEHEHDPDQYINHLAELALPLPGRQIFRHGS